MKDGLNAISEEELSQVSGGFGIRLNKNIKHEEPAPVTLSTTNTNCPKCHIYGQMKFSGGQLTCTCGYSWTVFV